MADINNSDFQGKVDLVSFSIINFSRDIVRLEWEVNYEINNYGFEIQRSPDNNSFETIGFVEGQGTSYSSCTYEFIDNNIESYKYYYRLKFKGYNRKDVELNTILFDYPMPLKSKLVTTYPNPFGNSTNIKFELSNPENVLIEIYSILGEKLITLENSFKPSGYYDIKWDGKNESGRTLSSGIYLCVFKVGNIYNVKKVTLLK